MGKFYLEKLIVFGENCLNINKEFHNSKDAKKLFLMLKYLCFVEPKYVKIIFNEIKEKIHINDFMIPFLNYFQQQFIDGRDIDSWNYYNMFRNRTNNCCEGYNMRLNGFFKTKPNIYKLLIILKDEEPYTQELYSILI